MQAFHTLDEEQRGPPAARPADRAEALVRADQRRARTTHRQHRAHARTLHRQAPPRDAAPLRGRGRRARQPRVVLSARIRPAAPVRRGPGAAGLSRMRAGYRVGMHTHHIEIAIRPLSDWPDDQVLLVYRLLAADVREILADPDHDPAETGRHAARCRAVRRRSGAAPARDLSFETRPSGHRPRSATPGARDEG